MMNQPAPAAEVQPVAPQAMPISRESLNAAAVRIQSLFADGFQWYDIVGATREAAVFMNMFHNLSVEERKKGVVEIVDLVIDMTDTPYLPDSFSDPIFKAISRPCIDLVFSKIEGLRTTSAKEGSLQTPTTDEISKFKSEIQATFADGFQWQDLFSVISYTAEFIEDYLGMGIQEKRQLANEIVDWIIDETDTPYLPDTFSDPIFKSISHAVIEMLIV